MHCTTISVSSALNVYASSQFFLPQIWVHSGVFFLFCSHCGSPSTRDCLENLVRETFQGGWVTQAWQRTENTHSNPQRKIQLVTGYKKGYNLILSTMTSAPSKLHNYHYQNLYPVITQITLFVVLQKCRKARLRKLKIELSIDKNDSYTARHLC